MFSDFVTFNDLILFFDGQPINNSGLLTLDITHDNEYYQLFLTANNPDDNLEEMIDLLTDKLTCNLSVCLKVDYDLKMTGVKIEDLYRVLPEKNKWLTTCKQKDGDLFVLKCRLLARNNISFDYDRVDKVANF
ncbi:MAG: hypothetical protein AB1782_11555 [Cyanobacteriota bacterium]